MICRYDLTEIEKHLNISLPSSYDGDLDLPATLYFGVDLLNPHTLGSLVCFSSVLLHVAKDSTLVMSFG